MVDVVIEIAARTTYEDKKPKTCFHSTGGCKKLIWRITEMAHDAIVYVKIL